MGYFKKKFRSVKKLPSWLYVFPELLVRLWLFSCRVRVSDPYNQVSDSHAVIPLLWHNRLLFFPLMFPREVRERTVALISPSRDGQYIADFAARFGVRALRGSSRDRGMLAQHQAFKELAAGNHVVFTPDGPRGPKYKMSRGPIHLAGLSGRPIVPLAINASRYWQLRSWDNFQLPKPFCRIDLVVGKPLNIPADLSTEEMERERVRIENELKTISRDL